jgi:signal recognition particle subunit SRP54
MPGGIPQGAPPLPKDFPGLPGLGKPTLPGLGKPGVGGFPGLGKKK